MKKITLNDIKKAHFIGIGGISMSGLARTLHSRGVSVTGSDIKECDLILQLRDIGVEVSIGHKHHNVPEDCQLVIYTAAVKDDNPETLAAKEYNIPIISRAELIGLLMGYYKQSVGISGTHGKTTTTSLIAEFLLEADLDPTLNVGGILGSINSNFRVGETEYFIAEACEYCDSFSKFYPCIGIILNMENEHPDYYTSEDQLRDSFKKFAGNISPDGYLIINSGIDELDEFTQGIECEIITYGKKGDYTAQNIVYTADARSGFDIYCKGDFVTSISLNLPGEHNVENALAAFAAGRCLGVPIDAMKRAFESFSGAKRRFEIKGEWNGVKIIDDYAHHPTEVEATLVAAKRCVRGKIYTVFQPHTFSRTKTFLESFAEALSASDVVVLVDIFSAREVDDGSIHSKDLVREIAKLGADCHYCDSFDSVLQLLKDSCKEGDMIITMGAGDIFELGDMLLQL